MDEERGTAGRDAFMSFVPLQSIHVLQIDWSGELDTMRRRLCALRFGNTTDMGAFAERASHFGV